LALIGLLKVAPEDPSASATIGKATAEKASA
jgi:hypothetical protein